MFWLPAFTIIFIVKHGSSMQNCGPGDFHFEFTECDDDGGRWRVSIPNDNCLGALPQPPTRLTDCSVSCDEGQYFNVTQLTCATCPAGTYSLGGGVHYSSFQELPENFYAHTETFRSAFTVGRRRDEMECSQYGWQARNGVLASNGGPCAAVLVYTVRLVKPGILMYSYQYTDNDIIFEFQAQNEQCQTIDDAERAKWPPLTREGQWKTVQIQLKSGLNVLHWKTIGIDVRGSSRPVMIKTIEVTGVAYTSECSPCPGGSFSNPGSRQCQKCPENTYSPTGSSHCIQCNTEEYFAPKGSSSCIERPPCTSQDYYEIDSPCNEMNKTRAIFRWAEPQVCRVDDPSSVTLPMSGTLKTCPPCNPGMFYKNGEGCIFCPKNQQSDGLSACKNCSPSTEPNYGHQYQWWSDELPPGMTATCMSADDTTCSNQRGWQPAGDHVKSGRGHADDAYLVLSLKIAGFRGREGFVNGHPMEVGRISFTFELMCTTECEFLFMEGSARKEFTILKSWKGQQPRQHYSFVITRNDSYTFSWAFQKVSWDKSYIHSASRMFDTDVAKIFNINVTNTIDGGASSCLPCAQEAEGFGCIPCPPDHYIEDKTMICAPCPNNTIVTKGLPYGPQSCAPCGPGLTSTDRMTCAAKCNLTVEGTLVDLTNISLARVTIGSTLFTSSGTKYFHMFNMSICGDSRVTCANNVSYTLDVGSTEVQAKVCRSTIVPGVEEDKGQSSSLATQSVSLGDHLMGVSKNSSLNGILVIDEFVDPKGQDINFFYSTPLSTRACPKGRSTTITLRCVPEESGQGVITLPRQCPDGTCDGCSFHFLWSTPLACPICGQDDLIVVRGECTGGKQEIHYIAPSHCSQPDSIPLAQSVPCTTRLPFMIVAAILSTMGVALLLSLLLFCLYKKNKRLEYKYMKLMANSGSKDGMMELPPAESCALDDGEEDDVMFSHKSEGIMNKFKYKKMEDSSMMAKMNSSTSHSRT